jgi:hypothetical protein
MFGNSGLQRPGEQPVQEQAKYKYRVVWNEQKGTYEVHAIHPRVFSWLAITPDSAGWFQLQQ